MSPGGNDHQARLKASYAEWLEHRAILEAHRVRLGDKRTTPPPAFDASELFPELASRSTTTMRLHPRYGDEPAVDESKLGGTFLWPADELWPICRIHEIPFVTVLQLRASDFPDMPFPNGADLFQILWCPREHEFPTSWADPSFYWRKRQQITRSRPNPPPEEAYYEYVPFTCRLLPERVIEFPTVYDLPEKLVERIYKWEGENLGPDGMHVCEYHAELSAAPGTKIGGYVHWIQDPGSASCHCGRPMHHLLTIASCEWDGVIDPRWTAVEDQEILASCPESSDEGGQVHRAFSCPTGLKLGDCGQMQLFVCRHCDRWPIVANFECS